MGKRYIPNSDNKEIEEAFQEIQKGVDNLQIALKKKETEKIDKRKEIRKERIYVGDKVRIKSNIQKTQEGEGTVIRMKKDSGFITVLGRKGTGTIRRLEKNLKKIDSFTKNIKKMITSRFVGSRAAKIDGLKLIRCPEEGGNKKEYDDIFEEIKKHMSVV